MKTVSRTITTLTLAAVLSAVASVANAQSVTLRATPGDGQVVLHWTASNQNAVYQLRQRTGDTDGPWEDIPVNAPYEAIESHTVLNLTNGRTYAFRVREMIENTSGTVSNEVTATPWTMTGGSCAPDGRLPWFFASLFLAIFAVLPVVSAVTSWKRIGAGNGSTDLRAFNLPRGSVRAMLALLAVGSFVVLLTMGCPTSEVVTAFGTLIGAVVGVYFGGRAAAPPAEN